MATQFSEEQMKRTLNYLKGTPDGCDPAYICAHKDELRAFSTRLSEKDDEFCAELKEWFGEHYHEIREHLKDDREDFEKRLRDAGVDIDRHTRQREEAPAAR